MLLTLIVFLLVLSLLVFVHELGHFFVARKMGIRIEEFGFGLPPRVFGVKRGKTIYSLNWLPIGGFVKLYGEDEAELPSSTTDAFYAKPKRVRALVLTAGVVMNFLLAIVIISYIFTQGIEVPVDKVFIKGVASGSPAETAGILQEDQVLYVAGNQIKNAQQFIDLTKANVGKEMIVEVSRKIVNPCLPAGRLVPAQKVLGAYPGLKISCHGENLVFTVSPRISPPKGEGPIGVSISNTELRQYPWYKAPFLGTGEAFRISGLMIAELGKVLVKLITFQPVGADISGPLGIAQATGEAVKFGPMAVLQLIGLLSLNLAVVNILPFPALDGGRLLFIMIEAATRRKVKPKLEQLSHQVGMIVLLTLIVLVTINDLLRILRR